MFVYLCLCVRISACAYVHMSVFRVHVCACVHMHVG